MYEGPRGQIENDIADGACLSVERSLPVIDDVEHEIARGEVHDLGVLSRRTNGAEYYTIVKECFPLPFFNLELHNNTPFYRAFEPIFPVS